MKLLLAIGASSGFRGVYYLVVTVHTHTDIMQNRTTTYYKSAGRAVSTVPTLDPAVHAREHTANVRFPHREP